MSTPDLGRPRGRILVVEDDSEAAYYAVRVLTRMGHFNVVHTFDPVVALRRATAEPWDLVLTDVDLPGMTGLELLAGATQGGSGAARRRHHGVHHIVQTWTLCVSELTRFWRSRCRPPGSSRSRPR